MGGVYVVHFKLAERIRGNSKISLAEDGVREGNEATLF